jgi:hypothetical protein
MTQIERHQSRIRRIRAQFQKAGNAVDEGAAMSPEAHHVIGISQNFSENIPLFLQKNASDPAVKVVHPTNSSKGLLIY